MSETFRRRGMPVDLDIAERNRVVPQENSDNSAADRDYFGNLKKFHDYAADRDTSGYPTRGKGPAEGQKKTQ